MCTTNHNRDGWAVAFFGASASAADAVLASLRSLHADISKALEAFK